MQPWGHGFGVAEDVERNVWVWQQFFHLCGSSAGSATPHMVCARSWGVNWINVAPTVLGQQSWGFSGDHSPVSTSMSSTGAARPSGWVCIDRGSIQPKTHPALPQHTARERETSPGWFWKPPYLETLGRFPCISERSIQVCVGQLLLLLPSFQCCFPP